MIEKVRTENPYFLELNRKWLKVKVNVDTNSATKTDEDIESATFSLSKACFFLCGFTASYLKKQILESETYIMLPYLDRPESKKERVARQSKSSKGGKITYQLVETQPDILESWSKPPKGKRFGKQNASSFLQHAVHNLVKHRIDFRKAKTLDQMKITFNEIGDGKFQIGDVFLRRYRPLIYLQAYDADVTAKVLKKFKKSFSDSGPRYVADTFSAEVEKLKKKKVLKLPNTLIILEEIFKDLK